MEKDLRRIFLEAIETHRSDELELRLLDRDGRRLAEFQVTRFEPSLDEVKIAARGTPAQTGRVAVFEVRQRAHGELLFAGEPSDEWRLAEGIPAEISVSSIVTGFIE